MKKFFEKHDLFKMGMIVLIIAVVFSWIMPYTYFSGTEFVSDAEQGITRAGLFDLSTYGMLGFYYFTTFFIFLFIVGGFYKFLGIVPAYQAMTDKIASFFKGKEKVFVVASIVLYAILTSITANYMSVIILIPFSMTILSKLKVDKVTGIASTIGGILIGILASTYSVQFAGYIVSTFEINFAYEFLPVIIIGLVAIGLLSFFTVNRIDSPDKENLLEDVFAPKNVKTKKTGFVGLAVSLAVLFVIVVLAFIGWEDVFKVTVFSDFLTSVKESSIFGFNLFGSLLGENALAFGKWDGFTFTGVLLIFTLIIQILYRVPVDSVISSYSDGFKKINKSIVLILLVYAVLVVSVVFPTIPYICEGITKLGSNVFTWFLVTVVTSIFGVDLQYVLTLGAGYLTTVGNNNVAALALQVGYGLVQFVSPTSVILVLGLSLMDVKVKDYFKFMWKFLLGLFVVAIIVLAVVAFV